MVNRRPLRYRGLNAHQIEWYRRWIMRPVRVVVKWLAVGWARFGPRQF